MAHVILQDLDESHYYAECGAVNYENVSNKLIRVYVET